MSIWKRRRDRAGKLRSQHPHAAEILAFYEQVLGVQELLYRKTQTASWADGVAVRNDGETDLRLHLDQLPEQECRRLFRAFARQIGSVSTEVLAPIASRLAATDSPADDVLDVFLSRQPLDELSSALECKPPPLEFFPRAFLQPLVEAVADKAQAARRRKPGSPGATEHNPSTCCPRCGWPPLLGLLRDESEAKGERRLVCSLCSHEWRFPRSTCPACGEARADRLQYHVTDFWPHLRVEECESCQTYIKAVDLRTDGQAVSVVDELASVELDLWATEQGLEKLQRNLLGH